MWCSWPWCYSTSYLEITRQRDPYLQIARLNSIRLFSTKQQIAVRSSNTQTWLRPIANSTLRTRITCNKAIQTTKTSSRAEYLCIRINSLEEYRINSRADSQTHSSKFLEECLMLTSNSQAKTFRHRGHTINFQIKISHHKAIWTNIIFHKIGTS